MPTETTYTRKQKAEVENIFSRDEDFVRDFFMNNSYEAQVKMYRFALDMEYYETLTFLVKLIPELPEEFIHDVEDLNSTY